MEITTGRPATLAPNGIVACPHALASQAGVDILRAGGSAVDAAIATSAVLCVVYPHMTSVGGDAFWLIYDAGQRGVRYLNGGGAAAKLATLDWFHKRGMTEIPYRGPIPATLTSPGAVASWSEAHRALGKLSIKRCLEAAIGYARHGFPVTQRVAFRINLAIDELRKSPEAAAIFLPGGDVPKAGQLLKNTNLARSLEAIAQDGAKGFYDGDVGRELTRYAKENGGFFDLADLQAQGAEWSEPIGATYRDVTIYETAPPTQGITVLQMLKLLEPLELHNMQYLGADHVHLMVQAKHLAYHDRDRWLADPKFANVPTKMLLSSEYLGERRKLIDTRMAIPWNKVPSYGSLNGDTVYIAVVDQFGNAVSLTQSLYWGFGSAVVAGETGIVLQNRGAYFSLDPRHPNKLEPGKIPLHTLIASLGLKNSKLWSVFGCMGADGQPQTHLQVYSALIDFNRDIQEAIEAPRFLSGRFVLGQARDTLHVEARFPKETLNELQQRGHPLDRWGDWNELAGHAHGIMIDPNTNIRSGGSDPRSDGMAIGY